MKISFRLAAEGDTDILLSLMAAFNAIDGYHFDKNITGKNLRIFMADERLGRLWLILGDGTVIGYIALTFGFSFEFKGMTAFVDELFLQEAYRGKGVGGQVIDFVDHQAKQLGIKALHLEVERHNEKGKRLYLKKGFVEHGRTLMTKRFL